ncbi:uncharacterized protein LOC106073325 isoform X1 [Biomphalaria glabrata]|uniref:Uncharacterized protein LOC106073325 isoform X1 n=1 Tax=Biomphalaria glabrata TaxID=6526 RepID=A0A9U8EIQ3_BIOGL|nr:uncharacterized protein LOC106073325 isoform X1 [Biomphalaria glabrata]
MLRYDLNLRILPPLRSMLFFKAEQSPLKFKLVTNIYKTLKTVLKNITAPTQLRCAMSCVKEGNRCSSFVFQAKTLSCVIGSTVVSTPSARSVEHTLYWIEQPVACPKRNLTLVTIDSLDSCLWFSYPVLANRSEASRNCTSNGGDLISVRSLNKLVVLRNSTFNTNLWNVGFLWIGLMFDKVNQTYYWDDDGSEINSDWQI